MDSVKTKFITSEKLPLVIEPTDKNMSLQEMLSLLNNNNQYFKQNLLKYGGILLRNFPIKSVEDFSSVIKNMKTGNFLDYIGGDSPRTKIADGVYTSTEAPPSIKIPLHNELSFVKKYPSHIYFYCDTPPQEKGETIIADSRKIYNAVNPDVKKRFIDKKLRYVSCYFYKSEVMNLLNKLQNSHKSWTTVFETDKKPEVEQKCRENEFGYKWNKNDWIQINQVRPATMAHHETKEMVWFNQAHLFDFNPRLLGVWRYIGAKLFYCQKHTRLHEVYHADDSKIKRDDLYHILDVLDANTVYFPWQKGDILVLDNVLAMHGRETFTGKRRILTAMTGG
jgi:alpha-ketoglutarate-dependent taurine dioxygenase